MITIIFICQTHGMPYTIQASGSLLQRMQLRQWWLRISCGMLLWMARGLTDPAVHQCIMKGSCRGYHIYILKTLGLSRQKSPVQAILILLIESGFAFFGIQVSHFGTVPGDEIHKVFTSLTDSVLVDWCVYQQGRWSSSIHLICLWFPISWGLYTPPHPPADSARNPQFRQESDRIPVGISAL